MKNGGRDCSLPPLCLYRVNQFCIYNFCCSITDVIHLLHLEHHIGCFGFFGYIFFFGEVFYQPEKHILCLLIYIGKVSVQFTFCEQGRIKTFAVRLDILQQFRFFLLYLNIYGVFLFSYYPPRCFYLI